MLNQFSKEFDYILVPIGGGGLISGIITVFKELSPNTKIIGVEPEGAPSMKNSIQHGKRISLKEMDGFVAVSYTHLRAHETRHDLVCRLLLEKKKRL